MRQLTFALTCAGLLLAHPVAAQLATGLNWVAAVGVDVDHTEDGTTCTPNTRALTAEAELILRRAGITVDDDKKLYRSAVDARISGSPEEKRRAAILLPHSLYITTTGVHIGGRCAIGRSIELVRFEPTALGAAVMATYFTQDGVWSGPPSAVNSALREIVQEHVTTLANEILKARQEQ